MVSLVASVSASGRRNGQFPRRGGRHGWRGNARGHARSRGRRNAGDESTSPGNHAAPVSVARTIPAPRPSSVRLDVVAASLASGSK